MDITLFDLLAERGVDILLHAPVSGVLTDGDRVTGVETECREGRRAFFARSVIDCTGDGEVAFRAGVPFEIGRAGDGLMQPVSIMIGKTSYFSGKTGAKKRFQLSFCAFSV